MDNITTQSDTSQTQWHSIDTHNYNNYSPFNGIMAAFCSVFGLASAAAAVYGEIKLFSNPASVSVTQLQDVTHMEYNQASGPDNFEYFLIAATAAAILAATACAVHYYASQDKEAREDRALSRLNQDSKALHRVEANITPKYDKKQSEEIGKTIVSTMGKVQEIINNKKDAKHTEQTDPLENMMTV